MQFYYDFGIQVASEVARFAHVSIAPVSLYDIDWIDGIVLSEGLEVSGTRPFNSNGDNISFGTRNEGCNDYVGGGVRVDW